MKFWFLCLSMGLMFVSLSPAHAGLLEFFFPALRTREHAPQLDREARAVKAPFAELGERKDNVAQDAAVDTQQKIPAQPGAIGEALDRPHRSTATISDWVALSVSEALVFDKDRFLDNLEGTKTSFDDGGRAQYIQFLKAAGVSDALSSRGYDIKSFAQKTPLLLNEGVVDGRYRWLYEVPVKMSFVQQGDRGYEDANVESKDYTIRLQVGRNTSRADALGILIETWEGIPADKN